jgi:hypothetical protein
MVINPLHSLFFGIRHGMGGPWPQWVDVPNGPTAAPRPLICKTEKHRRAPHPAIFIGG